MEVELWPHIDMFIFLVEDYDFLLLHFKHFYSLFADSWFPDFFKYIRDSYIFVYA